MSSMQDKILRRMKAGGRGSVVTPKDFLDLGTREATDQALHRLVKLGTVQRVGRGLYYYPRLNQRLKLAPPPDLDDAAEALGRQVGSRVAPSGALAANRLGLSTQVPAISLYLTDGRSRTVRVDQQIVKLKHVPPKRFPSGSAVSTLVFQALQHLGKNAVDDRTIATLRKRLTLAQRRQVLRDARYGPDWLTDVVRRVAFDDHQRGAAHG